MTLKQLIEAADHEVWFRVDEPDGRRHFFWTADVFGGHGPTLDELGPLEDMECDDFNLVMERDPEDHDTVPMVAVKLNDENDETVDIDSIMDDPDYLPGDVAIALGL